MARSVSREKKKVYRKRHFSIYLHGRMDALWPYEDQLSYSSGYRWAPRQSRYHSLRFQRARLSKVFVFGWLGWLTLSLPRGFLGVSQSTIY